MVVQLEVEDQLIQKVGVETVKKFMKHQLSLLKLRYFGEKISTVIQQADLDHQREIEEAHEDRTLWELHEIRHELHKEIKDKTIEEINSEALRKYLGWQKQREELIGGGTQCVIRLNAKHYGRGEK